MKTTKSFLLFVATFFVAAFTLTSCLNDDDDYKAPTLEEQNQYQTLMAGNYGSMVRLYYPSYGNAVKYDSIEHYYWKVSVLKDSTITMNNFPVCKLDSAINIAKNDNTDKARELDALRTAIHNSTAMVNITAKYFVPNKNYIVDYGYNFPVYPTTFKQTFNYNGSNHDVYFLFDVTGGYGGYFRQSDYVGKVFEYSMCLAGICVDGYKSENLISGTYFRQILVQFATK